MGKEIIFKNCDAETISAGDAAAAILEIPKKEIPEKKIPKKKPIIFRGKNFLKKTKKKILINLKN